MNLHLTRLVLNMECRELRRDLADPYDMHRTLMRVVQDPSAASRPFLWRREATEPTQPQVLLVQSDEPLNWLALPPGFASSIEHRSWDPDAVLTAGRALRFRLVANPTIFRVPVPKHGEPSPQEPARGRRKRMGLRSEGEQLSWLDRQCMRLGLAEVEAAVVDLGLIRSFRKPGHPITVCAAQFDGVATVSDPQLLSAGLRSGVGHARMLGLGLFTVAPRLAEQGS